MDTLRVAQFINRLRPDGGAEKLLMTKAEVMARHGVELTVITTHWRPNCPDMVRDLGALGVKVVPFPGRRIVSVRRFIKLVRYLKRERFDVLHTHLTGATILGAVGGRVCDIPVVTTLHNTEMDSQSHFYQGRLESWLLKHWVSELVGVGEKTAAAHESRVANRRIDVIPNAVSEAPVLSSDQRQSIRQGMTGDADGTILISVGRLTQQKGFADLLDAFSRIHKIKPEAKLVIVGRGPLENDLQQQIHLLGLDDAVYMLGLRSDVPILLAASDVYVSASHWEGLPVAMLEAMSASLPIVATRVGDVPDVLGTEAGILVEPQQSRHLAETVLQLMGDEERQSSLASSAKKVVEQRFGAQAWGGKLRAVYERACGGGGLNSGDGVKVLHDQHEQMNPACQDPGR